MANEKRLIDANALLDYFRKNGHESEDIEAVKDAPTVDAVEVVRCKDCKHYHARGNKGNSAIWDCKKKLCCRSANMTVKPDDFCSFGERRTDETNFF